eukprot:1544463-Lingulodinium_polyedra.AAC.1
MARGANAFSGHGAFVCTEALKPRIGPSVRSAGRDASRPTLQQARSTCARDRRCPGGGHQVRTKE